MKKKLALFMAAIMSLTVVPVTSVFGAMDIAIEKLDRPANESEGVYNGNKPSEGIAYFLDILVDEDIEPGSQFRATLSGAEFTNVLEGNYNYFSYFDDDKDSNKVETVGGVDHYVDKDDEHVYFIDNSGYSDYETSAVLGNFTMRDDGYIAGRQPGSTTAQKDQELENEMNKMITDMKAAAVTYKAENEKLPALQSAYDTLKANPVTGTEAEVTAYNNKLSAALTALNTQKSKVEAALKAVTDYEERINDYAKENGYSKVDEDNPITSDSALFAIFSDFVNAGTITPSNKTDRVVWANINYDDGETMGGSIPAGQILVKKTGDSTMRVIFMEGVDVGRPNTRNRGYRELKAGVTTMDTNGDGNVTDAEREASTVANDDYYVRIPLPMTLNKGVETVELEITSTSGEISKKNYMVVDMIGDGTITTSDEAKGREIIELKDIRIEEITDGTITGGAFELVAPSGYRFKNKLTDVSLDTDPDFRFSIGMLDEDEGTLNYDKTSGTLITLVDYGAIAWTDDDDQTSLAIHIDPSVVTPSERSTSAILVKGLVIEPLDDDAVVDGEELFMEINEYEESEENDEDDYGPIQNALNDNNTVALTGGDDDGIVETPVTATSALAKEVVSMDVTNEEFKVASAVDWAVVLTPEEVVTLEAGRWAVDVDDDFHATAELTLKETEKGGWLADRTTNFTLPEGVEIRGVKITGYDNLNDDTDTGAQEEFGEFWDKAIDLGMFKGTSDEDYNVVDTEDFSQGKVSVNENVMSWKNIDVDTTEITEINFELYLSIAPTFKGDEITVELGGTAIVDEVEPVVIAEVLHPITVTTKVTDVQIGYQRYSVADIIIQENFAGAILKEDDGLVISMEDDYIDFGMEIAGYDSMTIDGDLKLDDEGARDIKSGNNQNGGIVFDVVTASKTASTITLKGVEVYVDRTVPYGVYNMSVHGESVFANREGGAWQHDSDDIKAAVAASGNNNDDEALFARFADPYEAPYVNLATEGSYTPLRSHVVISDGNPVVMIDGVEKTMTDVVPYRTTADGGSFMVPVRFASEVFGIEEKDTLWDDASGTFTLFTGGKTIQFIKNAGFYRVNGVDVQMMTGDVQVYSEVDPVAGRMYIPFRHLGRAFGIADIDITFDEATGTAHYNQPREN